LENNCITSTGSVLVIGDGVGHRINGGGSTPSPKSSIDQQSPTKIPEQPDQE
jgi:hypothetical protein